MPGNGGAPKRAGESPYLHHATKAVKSVLEVALAKALRSKSKQAAPAVSETAPTPATSGASMRQKAAAKVRALYITLSTYACLLLVCKRWKWCTSSHDVCNLP